MIDGKVREIFVDLEKNVRGSQTVPGKPPTQSRAPLSWFAKFGFGTQMTSTGEQSNVGATQSEQRNDLQRRFVWQQGKTEIGAA